MGLLPAAAAALPADVQRPLYVLPPLFQQTRSVVRRRILELGEPGIVVRDADGERSEEHTSELQSLMRISYAVFCLKKKKIENRKRKHTMIVIEDRTTYNK